MSICRIQKYNEKFEVMTSLSKWLKCKGGVEIKIRFEGADVCLRGTVINHTQKLSMIEKDEEEDP